MFDIKQSLITISRIRNMESISMRETHHTSMNFKNPQESTQKTITQFNCKTWVHKMETLYLFHFAIYIDSKYQLQIQTSSILFFSI